MYRYLLTADVMWYPPLHLHHGLIEGPTDSLGIVSRRWPSTVTEPVISVSPRMPMTKQRLPYEKTSYSGKDLAAFLYL
jgi:hypothetical protein